MRTVVKTLTDFGRSLGKLRGIGTGIWRRKRQLNARDLPLCRDSILLNTMPKSGSIYIQKSLAKILRCPTVHLGNSYALIDQIGVRSAKAFSSGGYIAQDHLAPSLENLQILQHFKLKMVLHLRDPRQALLSWVYNTDWVSGGSDTSEFLLYCTPRPPPGYSGFSFSRKIDWQIETYLPQLVAWAARWVEIADGGAIPILITHQNDLRTAEKAFFDSILAFYQLSLDYALPNLPRTMEETHFRRADPMEWTQSFTPDQAARATSLIPVSLRRRFGWDDLAGCAVDVSDGPIGVDVPKRCGPGLARLICE
jgi:hypothetical protein